jgi:acetyl-CoA carboxylase biotin carboxyl carrier protein
MSQADQHPAGADAEVARLVWDEARALIDRLEGSTVSRLAVEAGDYRIEIERSLPPVAAPGTAPTVSETALAPGAVDGAPAAEDHRHAVTAPLVGKFYRSSKPGADPFVEPGDVVEEGQTVCIVEAMKMMNEVAAGQRGRVAEIVVDNEEYVEFGQALMYLEPLDGQ